MPTVQQERRRSAMSPLRADDQRADAMRRSPSRRPGDAAAAGIERASGRRMPPPRPPGRHLVVHRTATTAEGTVALIFSATVFALDQRPSGAGDGARSAELLRLVTPSGAERSRAAAVPRGAETSLVRPPACGFAVVRGRRCRRLLLRRCGYRQQRSRSPKAVKNQKELTNRLRSPGPGSRTRWKRGSC